MRICTVALTLMVVSFCTHASDNHTQKIKDSLVMDVGGYTQVKIDTGLQQKYPLLSVTSLKFPSSIKYIGQSLNYALSLSGYTLENLQLTDVETLKLYSLKLPLTNRDFIRSTTLQVVETIIGAGFEVGINEESRIITITPVKQS